MEEIINKLKAFFAKKKEISMAFLFGSAAANRLMAESDVDVAVWFDKKYTLKEINHLQGEIELLLHRNVDLIVLNDCRATVAWSALRGKKLIIRDYRLYLRKLLDFSNEAEDFQNFVLDFWRLRRKLRGGFS